MQASSTRTLRLSRDAYYVVACGGEPPADDAVGLALADVAARGASHVIVNILATRRLDDAVLGRLVTTAEALRRSGGGLWLVAADPRLLDELELDASTAAIHLEPSLAGAVSALNAHLVA